MSDHVRGPFTISTDPARLDVTVLHEFLSQAYWSIGIPKSVIERSIQHSLCFGLYEGRAPMRDAHGLYAQFGFTPLKHADRHMEIARPNIYVTLGAALT